MLLLVGKRRPGGDRLILLDAKDKRRSEPALSVLASVDEVRVVEGQLNSAGDNVVHSLDTEHERVVLVADLVPPAAEATTGPDVHILELGEKLLEDTLTLERGSGVTVVELAVVGGDDLILGLDHLGVDETLDAVLEQVLLINRLHARLRNLEHDGPVRTLLSLVRAGLGAIGVVEGGELGAGLGLVVGGVVGEDGGAVEGAVVLGEVEPALVANALGTLATETDADDVGGGVVQTLGEGDKLLVAHLLNKLIHGHGVDELVVLDGGAVTEGDNLLLSIDLGDLAVLAVALVLLGKGVGDSDPDTTGSVTGGEAEGSVRTPVAGSLVEDDVLGDKLDVGGSDTLTEPLALHLFRKLALVGCWGKDKASYRGGGHGPDLVVVGPHEDVGNTLAAVAQDPLIEVLGLSVGYTVLKSGIDHALNALDLILIGQHGDVVLERIGDPETLVAHIGNALMCVPIIFLGKSLVNAVVEVLVVREDNVATDIVEEALRGDICGGETTGLLVGVNNQPRRAVLEVEHNG